MIRHVVIPRVREATEQYVLHLESSILHVRHDGFEVDAAHCSEGKVVLHAARVRCLHGLYRMAEAADELLAP